MMNWLFSICDPKRGTHIGSQKGVCEVRVLVELPGWNIACTSKNSNCSIEISGFNSTDCIQTLQGHKNIVTALILLADGTLASGSCDHTIKIWNPTTGNCIQTLEGHNIIALLQLADGTLVSGSSDGNIKIWGY